MDSLSISWSMYIYKPILVQLKRHLKFGGMLLGWTIVEEKTSEKRKEK